MPIPGHWLRSVFAFYSPRLARHAFRRKRGRRLFGYGHEPDPALQLLQNGLHQLVASESPLANCRFLPATSPNSGLAVADRLLPKQHRAHRTAQERKQGHYRARQQQRTRILRQEFLDGQYLQRFHKIRQRGIELLRLFVEENVTSILERDECPLRHLVGNGFAHGNSVAEDA